MADPAQAVRPDAAERAILLSLSGTDGWTSGQIAAAQGAANVRKHGQIIRRRLTAMEQCGWVGRLDDRAPVAWVRTQLGTEIIDAR